MKCKDCGSTNLDVAYTIRGPSGIPQGRHHTGELDVLVFLGCQECSATLAVESLSALPKLYRLTLDQAVESKLNYYHCSVLIVAAASPEAAQRMLPVFARDDEPEGHWPPDGTGVRVSLIGMAAPGVTGVVQEVWVGE
jgi:hypothetical protein